MPHAWNRSAWNPILRILAGGGVALAAGLGLAGIPSLGPAEGQLLLLAVVAAMAFALGLGAGLAAAAAGFV